MTDSFSQVRKSLIALINDVENKVIALKGKWGTGKTFLWDSVKKDLFSGEKKERQAVYVSLFGAKTIDELKLRIIKNAYLKDNLIIEKITKTGGGFAKSAAKFFGIDFSPKETLLIWLSSFTNGKLIVIDDIERKHKSLDIDELLGFLDEYSETHNTRFLVLLNTDKLQDQKMWVTLHEKVIDAELVLNPSPSEAFKIVANKGCFNHLAEVEAALAILNVNNIRVIERVLKLVKQISSIVPEDGVHSSRWIPSTVLLAASQYHAVENPPPVSYILSFNSYAFFSKKEGEFSSEEIAWNSMLNKLGISYPDEYEDILVNFFNTGLLDSDRLKSLFIKYKSESGREALKQKLNDFYDDVHWTPQKNKSELVDIANELYKDVNSFNHVDISFIVDELENLGEIELSRSFLNSWLDSVDKRPEYQSIGERGYEYSRQKIHPKVISKLNEMRDKQHPPLNVTEAIERIVKNSGWGDREKHALGNSTVADYENALRTNSNDILRLFVREHLDWLKKDTYYDDNFKNGAYNFLNATINICSNEPNSRLAEILKENFKYYGLLERLSPT
ncbi:MAG TPA: hypothetical protein PLR90_03655 [Methylophilus sp.]|nr:hypothetical protein [Methylophilus sp.]HQQ32992.1 hypothetical protein [Methylophilus sp.]